MLYSGTVFSLEYNIFYYSTVCSNTTVQRSTPTTVPHVWASYSTYSIFYFLSAVQHVLTEVCVQHVLPTTVHVLLTVQT